MNESAYAQRLNRFNAGTRWKQDTARLFDLAQAYDQTASTPRKWLDFGAGNGMLTKDYKRLYDLVMLVEPNGACRSQAIRNAGNRLGVHFRTHVDAHMVLRNHGQFNLVTCVHSLAHVHDMELTCRQLGSMTPRGGVIGVINPNPLHETLMWPINRVTGYRSDPTIKKNVSVRALTRAMIKAGVRQKHLEYTGPHATFAPFVYRGRLNYIWIGVKQ